MKLINHLLAGVAAASGILCAQTPSSTAPIGFNKIVCLKNSDTIVGVPFRQQGSVGSITSGVPIPAAEDFVEIPLQISSLTPSSLGQHYLKFEGGTRDGRWYDITTNTASSVTINLNGDDLTGVVAGNRVVITEYWTLDTLFPPAQATTAWSEDTENPGQWIQNGNAIMRSEGTLPFQLRTLVLLPDTEGTGINRSPLESYFAHGGRWKAYGKGDQDFGTTVIFPDSMFTVRHPSSVSHNTVFRAVGEVEMDNISIPLQVNALSSRDIFVGLPRPVDMKLSKLNLWQSGAFMQSEGTLPFQWRDMLLVFDNSQSSINKSPMKSYFHNGVNWLAIGDNSTMNRDDEVIPAGSGFIIRKYRNISGETSFWRNLPNY